MADEGYGVRFAGSDYAGLGRRLLIDLVDGAVFLMFLGLMVAIAMVGVPAEARGKFLFFGLLAGCFAYFVLLKFWGRTLGYVLVGVELVNLQGRRPSWWSLILRMIFLFLGPEIILLELIWLGGDACKQAIHDKFCRTYVVRRGSKPVGGGRIRYVRLDLFGYNMLTPEVVLEDEFPVAADALRK